MNVTLRIETRTVIRILAIISLFGLLIFGIMKAASVLLIVAIAFFLALALNPPVTRLARLLPGENNRIAATAIAYVFVLSILGVLAYVAAPPIINQTNSFVNNLPGYVKSMADKDNAIGRIIEQYQLQDELDQFIDKAKKESGTIAQGVGASFINGVSSVLNGTVTVFTILVLTFLMLIEGPGWIARLWSLYTHKHRLERDKRVLTQMYKVVTGFVNGQVLVAAIGASCALVVLFVLTRIFADVPLSALLPLTGVVFIASLIPMFGATIAATIVVIVLLFNSIPAAIVFLIYFIIYQQIENNVLQPVVQSRTVALSARSVFIAAVVGISMLGIVGAIMAIPIAGCIRVLVLDFIHNKNDYMHSAEAENDRLLKVSSKKG